MTGFGKSDLISERLIGVRVDVIARGEAAQQIVGWSHSRLSSYICLANVHMLMESFDDPIYGRAINNANMVLPDGVPLVWFLRMLGRKNAVRVKGADLMREICLQAEQNGVAVGFYGTTEKTIQLLIERIRQELPKLVVSYQYSPPFQPLTRNEKKSVIGEIG